MGLLGDIDEVKLFWKTASLPTKIVLVVSTFLALSSITSLSEAIFKWKGFISDGLEFYYLYVSKPVRELLSFFGLIVTETKADYAILIILFYSGWFRVLFDWGKEVGYKNHSFIMMVVLRFVTIVMLLIVITTDFLYQDDDVHFYAIFILFGLVSSTLFNPKFEKRHKLLMYIPVVSAVLIVLILGAINAGLSQ